MISLFFYLQVFAEEQFLECTEKAILKSCSSKSGNVRSLSEASLAIKTNACQEQLTNLDCDGFFKEYPEFAQDRMQCSVGEVCEQGKVTAFFEGCRDYGIEIKDSFLAELKENLRCLRDQTCFANKQRQQILVPTFLFFHSLVNWKGQLSQTKKAILKDYENYRHLNCLNKKFRNQFLCHLQVKYGAAVLSTSPTGMGAKELIKVRNLEAKLARFKAASKTNSFENLQQAFEKSDDVFLMKGGRPRSMIDGLEKNKSYTVIFYEDRLVLGDDYFGPDGNRKASHVKLLTDTTLFINKGRPAKGYDNLGYKDRGGTVKIYDDGSIDVSGYHLGNDSALAADKIAEHISKIFPDSVIRKTPGRLDTLPPKGK